MKWLSGELMDKNMNTMSQYRSVLFDLLEQEEAAESRITEIHDLDTREDKKALSIVLDGKTYRLNSSFRPGEEAKKWADQFPFQNGAVVAVLYGMGNAVFAEELLNRLQDDGMLIIYEPSLEIFIHTLSHYDMSRFLKEKRVAFCVKGINHLSLQDALIQNVAYSNINSEILCEHPGYKQAFLEEYYEYRRIIRICWERVHINKNTLEKFGKIVCKNTLENWHILDNVNVIDELKEYIPNEVPAIIVGAGPSLDKNIEELRNAKGKSLIIATDSSFKYLMDHDVIPDFLITIDPEKGYWHFRNRPYEDIPLFTKIEANPKILEGHRARKILFNCQPFLCSCFAKLGKTIPELGGGGSVATAAYAVCVELRLKTIILIGQDLAYSGEFTHAGEKISVGINKDDSGKIKVKGIDGTMVRTRGDWKNYLDWYEMTGRLLEENDVVDITTIDATEGGAEIYGTKVMTLKEAVGQYCLKSFDVPEAVRSMKPSLDMENLVSLNHLSADAVQEMQELKEKTEKIMPLCEKLINIYKTSQAESYLAKEMSDKIYKHNDWIGKQQIYTLLNDYITAITADELSDINQVEGTILNQKKKIFSHNLAVYHAVLEAADTLLPLMKEYVLDKPFL